MFETNVIERVNSGQISLVVTCTADCTCHHDGTRLLCTEISGIRAKENVATSTETRPTLGGMLACHDQEAWPAWNFLR